MQCAIVWLFQIMVEHDKGSDQYNCRLEEYINKVLALKMLVNYTLGKLCRCLKVFSLRERFVHERECVWALHGSMGKTEKSY